MVQDASAVKILTETLKGFGVIGVLTPGGRVSHKFSARCSGKNMRQKVVRPKMFSTFGT